MPCDLASGGNKATHMVPAQATASERIENDPHVHARAGALVIAAVNASPVEPGWKR
jgi:hypothetical protein